jgi:ribosome biogenesis GTPase
MTLEQLGWRGPREGLVAPGESLGRVAVEHRDGFVLYTEAGEIPATLAGRLRHEAEAVWPAVGDWVAFRAAPDRGTIHRVLPRSGVFTRKAAGRAVAAQVVAANVDVVFLVAGLDGNFNPRRLERYLALAREGGVDPAILLSKADLCDDPAEASGRAEAVAPGVPVHAISTVTGLGLAGLEAYFSGDRTVALLGSSGVGKSTLINALLGRDAQRVRAVRDDGKGRHTTTHRELILRPGGGLLIDTPGMRELQLWGGGEDLGDVFSEVDAIAPRCRFRDCSHTSEPGCAVLAAVRDGTLPEDRLRSYHKLQGELRYLESLQDESARAERKRKEKVLTRAAYRWLVDKRIIRR